MSNTTDTPRESGGGNRRRRSRGGQKRRQNNNPSGGDSREPRQKHDRRGNSEDNRRQGGQSGKNRRNPMPKPAKLTWWQKLLKALGLYKEPVKPARKPRTTSEEPKSAPKSNTRVARGAKPENAEPADAPQGERRQRKSRQRGEGRTGGDPSSVESARVYVGNLSYDATEQDIKELFKGIGSVRNVEIVYDRKTHRSKGFGFVEMIHVDEAKRAVEVLHDQFFMGREMVVSGAQNKGQDEREEQEETRTETPKPVELAPLPPAAAVESDLTEKTPESESDEAQATEVASTDIVTPVIVPPLETVETPAAEIAPTIEEVPAIAEAPEEDTASGEASASEEPAERKPEA